MLHVIAVTALPVYTLLQLSLKIQVTRRPYVVKLKSNALNLPGSDCSLFQRQAVSFTRFEMMHSVTQTQEDVMQQDVERRRKEQEATGIGWQHYFRGTSGWPLLMDVMAVPVHVGEIVALNTRGVTA